MKRASPSSRIRSLQSVRVRGIEFRIRALEIERRHLRAAASQSTRRAEERRAAVRTDRLSAPPTSSFLRSPSRNSGPISDAERIYEFTYIIMYMCIIYHYKNGIYFPPERPREWIIFKYKI